MKNKKRLLKRKTMKKGSQKSKFKNLLEKICDDFDIKNKKEVVDTYYKKCKHKEN